MANLDSPPGPREYLSSLRQHVREPIVSAIERAQRERREVEAEREAFETFVDRVADLPTVSAVSTEPAPPAMLPRPRTGADSETLRRVYRETVMDVPHYEAVYDEPVTMNVRAELGPEVASLFESTAATLSPTQQGAVLSAAREAATAREEFCDTLEAEVTSLRTGRDDLGAILDQLDSTTVPAWYSQQFRDELLSIITTRQTQLTERPLSSLDRHNLCEWLYGDGKETYPVLVAVARLLDCVTVRH
jgi:hypothetical protein